MIIHNVTAPAWMADAVCASVDPALFFPEKGLSARAAKSICATCPAAAACLAWAIDNHISSGVYGGHTAAERSPRRRAAA